MIPIIYYRKLEARPTLDDTLGECWERRGTLCAGGIQYLAFVWINWAGWLQDRRRDCLYRHSIYTDIHAGSLAPLDQHQGTPATCSSLPATLTCQPAVQSRSGTKKRDQTFSHK